MRILIFALVAALPAVAFASEQVAPPDEAKPQIIRFCEHPETREQVEFNSDGPEACPEGFTAYDDVTAIYIEHVEDAPPPLPMKHEAETEAHAQ